MKTPANHEADMMGTLEQHAVSVMWWNRRRMFEQVVNRPEMWMTNDHCWFIISLMSVLFMALSVWLNNAIMQFPQDERLLFLKRKLKALCIQHFWGFHSVWMDLLINHWSVYKLIGHLHLPWTVTALILFSSRLSVVCPCFFIPFICCLPF